MSGATQPPSGVIQPALGVAKVVKLGNDTVLIIEVKDEQVAEGSYDIKAIQAHAAGPSGALSCIIWFGDKS